jgi:hypothetical protein
MIPSLPLCHGSRGLGPFSSLFARLGRVCPPANRIGRTGGGPTKESGWPPWPPWDFSGFFVFSWWPCWWPCCQSVDHLGKQLGESAAPRRGFRSWYSFGAGRGRLACRLRAERPQAQRRRTALPYRSVHGRQPFEEVPPVTIIPPPARTWPQEERCPPCREAAGKGRSFWLSWTAITDPFYPLCPPANRLRRLSPVLRTPKITQKQESCPLIRIGSKRPTNRGPAARTGPALNEGRGTRG